MRTPTVNSSTMQPTHADTARTPACAVRDVTHGVGLFATREIPAGSPILTIEGRAQAHATRFSIQIDAVTHIDAGAVLPDAEMRVRYPWRFLNHSCEPNARVEGRSLRAIRAITTGEQITFDYTTTEADMSTPFECLCGTTSCIGLVRGFNHLPEAARRARLERLAPHLRALVAVRADGAV